MLGSLPVIYHADVSLVRQPFSATAADPFDPSLKALGSSTPGMERAKPNKGNKGNKGKLGQLA